MKDNPIILSTLDDVLNIKSGTTSEKKYYRLSNDIELPYRDLRFPLGKISNVSIDGNGFSFLDLNIRDTGTKEGWGIFSIIENVDVSNLGMDGFYLVARAKVGAFAGTAMGQCSFTNCYVRNIWLRASAPNAVYSKFFGNFIGYCEDGSTTHFDKCFVSMIRGTTNQTILANSESGGFVGAGGSGHTFNDCYFLGGIRTSGRQDAGTFISTNYDATFTNTYQVSAGSQNHNVQGTDLGTKENLENQQINGFINYIETNNNLPMQIVFVGDVEEPNKFEEFKSSFVERIATTKDLLTVIKPNVEIILASSHMESLATKYTLDIYNHIRYEAHKSSYVDGLNTKESHTMKVIRKLNSFMNGLFTDTKVLFDDIQIEIIDNVAHAFERGDDLTVCEMMTSLYVEESESQAEVVENKTGVKALAYVGDTIKLQAVFKDYSNNPFQPQDVVLTIYKPLVVGFEKLKEVKMTDDNLVGKGIYEYYYTVSEEESDDDYLVYEFAGMYNEKPTLARGKIPTRFV